jgi:hypothetical protein
MGMGIRVIGGAGDDALSVDSGSLLVKPYMPGSPYTAWMAPTDTATAANAARYWTSAAGCRGFRLEVADSATWTASQGFLAAVFDTTVNLTLTANLAAAVTSFGTPAGTALANTLYSHATGTDISRASLQPIESWVSGDTRIKTVAVIAHKAIRAKLTIWV